MPTELTATEILARLSEGNARWAACLTRGERRTSERRAETAKGQNPFVTVLACADSRVSPALIFDEGVGDLFVVRTAGHVVDTAVLSSLAFGASILKTPVVVVMGHTDCGAVTLVRSGVDYGSVLAGVSDAISAEVRAAPCADSALQIHVEDTVRKLEAELDAVVVGVIYDTGGGGLRWL
ncbi:MAG: carbonic anhydrase [Bradymonadia bacterium]|jgi:carbonic anhydrase